MSILQVKDQAHDTELQWLRQSDQALKTKLSRFWGKDHASQAKLRFLKLASNLSMKFSGDLSALELLVGIPNGYWEHTREAIATASSFQMVVIKAHYPQVDRTIIGEWFPDSVSSEDREQVRVSTEAAKPIANNLVVDP